MIEDIYRIVSAEGQEPSCCFRIAFNLDSLIYRVHFPGNPITPGACQLEIVRQLAGKVLGCNVRILTVRNIKYLQIIDPRVTSEVSVSLSFSESDDPGQKRLSAIISDGASVYTKTSIILGLSE